MTATGDNDWEGMKGFSAPARRALLNAGYTRLSQLTKVDQKTIASLHGMGPKVIEVLRVALAEKGQSFAE